MYARRKNNQPLFARGLTDAPQINTVQNNVTLTLGFEL